ncbi:F-box domain-containing protein [Mycena indigotica]|uniref:F-box domain-containing protein n=1 Tax=Mycena indigotica TaxID=2126181 RepID=A0A8H6VST7_9AGAR|nr:F-box domain-containing protein [Mycena indigotica]KAF7292697.1 F-box domain-containing protein [Mycena indigotica]
MAGKHHRYRIKTNKTELKLAADDDEDCPTLPPLPNMSNHPIHSLPVELIAHIFVHSLDTHPNPNLSSRHSPLLFTRICARWRAIALQTPALWSAVSLELYSPVKDSSLHAMLAFWLSHSKEHPLDLYLHYRHRMLDDTISLLAGSADQWTNVDLFVHSTTMASLDTMTQYGRRQESGFCHLRRLSLGIVPVPGSGQSSHLPITCFSQAPLLTEVKLYKIPPCPDSIELPWTQLTSLEVKCSDIHSSLNVLRATPLLTNLHVQIDCPPAGGLWTELVEDNATGEYAHSALKSLSINVHPAALSTAPIRALLRLLPCDLPALESLVLPTLTPDDVSAFTAFVDRANLESLTIALAPLPAEGLCQVFSGKGMKRLRFLELRHAGENTLCALFDKLAGDLQMGEQEVGEGYDQAPAMVFLPSLQSLHVDSFRSAVPYPALLSALRAPGRASPFSFSMTVTAPRRGSVSENTDAVEEVRQLKAKGLKIAVEHLYEGSAI